jgi:hypothetical protein
MCRRHVHDRPGGQPSPPVHGLRPPHALCTASARHGVRKTRLNTMDTPKKLTVYLKYLTGIDLAGTVPAIL